MVVVDELHIVHSGTSTDLTAGAHAHQQVLPQSMVDEHGLERVDDSSAHVQGAECVSHSYHLLSMISIDKKCFGHDKARNREFNDSGQHTTKVRDM